MYFPKRNGSPEPQKVLYVNVQSSFIESHHDNENFGGDKCVHHRDGDDEFMVFTYVKI